MQAMENSGHEGEIPLPMASTYVVHHHHHPASAAAAARPPSLSAALSAKIEEEDEEEEENHNHHHNLNDDEDDDQNKKQLVVMGGGGKVQVVIRYRECLKNHAAAMGGTATDGCGEFMPSGEDGSLEALKCSACGCHRNFHRKEVGGGGAEHHHHFSLFQHYHHPREFLYPPPHGNNNGGSNNSKGMMMRSVNNALIGYVPGAAAASRPPALIMPLGAIHTTASDSADDMETDTAVRGAGAFPHSSNTNSVYYANNSSSPVTRKRFRTKFTAEQKERMLGFAEKVGWRLPRQEEGAVQRFCQEIGVKRRVLKVWMHNNKHNYLAGKKLPGCDVVSSNNTATGNAPAAAGAAPSQHHNIIH